MYEYPDEVAPATLSNRRWNENIITWNTIKMSQKSTYNAPAMKRRKIIEIVFIAKADMNEKINPPVAATRNTFFRPL